MAFAGFGRKGENTGGGPSRKTGTFVETARLNNEISRLMESMEELQFELGKTYYEENRQKSVGPYIEYIKKIRGLEYDIRVRNEKLLSQKGLLYCAGCDELVSWEDEFCSKCGTPVPLEKRRNAYVNCRNCDAEVKKDRQYCQACGVLLFKPEIKIDGEGKALPQTVPVQTPPAPPEPMPAEEPAAEEPGAENKAAEEANADGQAKRPPRKKRGEKKLLETDGIPGNTKEE